MSQEKIYQLNKKYELVYSHRNKKSPKTPHKGKGAPKKKETPSSNPHLRDNKRRQQTTIERLILQVGRIIPKCQFHW
jgi:hypothetical protein